MKKADPMKSQPRQPVSFLTASTAMFFTLDTAASLRSQGVKLFHKKKRLAEFHSRHFYGATIAAKAFRAL